MTEDATAAPTFDEVMASYIDAAEKANRYLSQLDRTEEQLADARARIAALEADKNVLAGQLRTSRDIAAGHRLLIAGGESEIAELAISVEAVKSFIDERPEYITAILAGGDNDDDINRWRGGAEARRQLAERLGLTVPHNPGETTEPVKPKEATTNA